jgi:hypothetical protein
VETLCEAMKNHPLPISYYPGCAERWHKFRNAYPNQANEIGNIDDRKRTQQERQLHDSAVILPWLVITIPQTIDLTSTEGRELAKNEYAFLNEPFSPVVTIAYYSNMNPKTIDNEDGENHDDADDDADDLNTAVTIANEYIYGSLSCTVVTNDADISTENCKLQEAISNLRYGGVAINCWSALIYAGPGGTTWGAYPGEVLANVRSGIGQVQNHYFVRHVEKTVLRTPFRDVGLHICRPVSYVQSRKECIAVGNLSLRPGLYTISNLICVSMTGYELPSTKVVVGTLVGMISCAVAVVLTHNSRR